MLAANPHNPLVGQQGPVSPVSWWTGVCKSILRRGVSPHTFRSRIHRILSGETRPYLRKPKRRSNITRGFASTPLCGWRSWSLYAEQGFKIIIKKKVKTTADLVGSDSELIPKSALKSRRADKRRKGSDVYLSV